MEKKVKKVPLHDQVRAEREFWRNQTPEARINAVTFLINQHFGLNDESTPRLPRILTVVKRRMH